MPTNSHSSRTRTGRYSLNLSLPKSAHVADEDGPDPFLCVDLDKREDQAEKATASKTKRKRQERDPETELKRPSKRRQVYAAPQDESELELVVPTAYSSANSSVFNKPAKAGPPGWPPEHDLGVYSHDRRLSKADYRRILGKVGLAVSHADNIALECYNRTPSPDQLPFLTPIETTGFALLQNYKLLEPKVAHALAYTLAGKHSEKLFNQLFSRKIHAITTASERELIGVDDELSFEDGMRLTDFVIRKFAGLQIDEQRLVIKRHRQRIEMKHAIIEFAVQKRNPNDPFRMGKAPNFFSGPVQKGTANPVLNREDFNTLVQNSFERNTLNKQILSRARLSDPGVLFVAHGILSEIALPEQHLNLARDWPVQHERDIILKGQEKLPSLSKVCILISTEPATYVRLTAQQASKIILRERNVLGFVPSWTNSLGSEERYSLGLLPPSSQAFVETKKYDRDFVNYLGTPLGTNSHGRITETTVPELEGVKSSLDTATSQKRTQSTSLQRRFRERSSNFEL